MGYKAFWRICQDRGYSQTYVAKNTGIAQQSISGWKLGRYSLKIEKLEKLADFLNVPVSVLAEPDTDETIPVSQNGYYTNEATAKMAQHIFENPELHALFDSACDASADDLRTVHTMLLALKRKEQGE